MFSSRTSLLLSLLPLLAPAAGAQTIIVNQVGTAFTPSVVTVPVGGTVRWVWSGGIHTVTEGNDGSVDGNEAFHSALTASVPMFEVTFDAAFLAANPPTGGDHYDYFCAPHFTFGMTGVVMLDFSVGTVVGACDGSGAAAPCGNTGSSTAGCANSTAQGTELVAAGSTSVAADDLTFDATSLPTNQPALLFAGTTALQGGGGTPFGDGLRVAGGTVVRLGVKGAGAAGAANWGPGLGALGGWSAGQTRTFQVWYRDPVGGPCGSGFNLSNGLQITFTN